MKATVLIHLKGHTGVYGTFASHQIDDDGEIDEYLDDLREFLKETLENIKEEVYE